MVRPVSSHLVSQLCASSVLFRRLRAGFLRQVLRFAHTRGKRLLQLLGLVLILEDKGVEVTVAADLELDLLGGGLLNASSCPKISLGVHFWAV